jgi:hypothetical protein
MIIDKSVVIRMLQTHWVRDAVDITPTGDRIQLVLVPRTEETECNEPFNGLTDEIMSLIKSDAAKWILGCASDTDRKIINIQMNTPESTHTEGRP